MDTTKWNVCLRLSLAIPDSQGCDPFKQSPLMWYAAFSSHALHSSVSIDLFQHHSISSYRWLGFHVKYMYWMYSAAVNGIECSLICSAD